LFLLGLHEFLCWLLGLEGKVELVFVVMATAKPEAVVAQAGRVGQTITQLPPELVFPLELALQTAVLVATVAFLYPRPF